MKILCVLPTAVLSACASIHVPPCTVTSDWGIARADTPELAEELSSGIESVAPRILAVIPRTARTTLDVRLVSHIHPCVSLDIRGACVEGPTGSWIEIEHVDHHKDQSTLAHELVHLCLGPDWDPLPPALEDGLANLVQSTLFPEEMVESRLHFVSAMSSALDGGFKIDSYGAAVGRRRVPFSLSVTSGSRFAGIPEVCESVAANDEAYREEDDQSRFG